MAAWSYRHLNRNPRPALNYEPVFFIRPMAVPPAPAGHDPIVPGDTDTRMDWEFLYMREILGIQQPAAVEKGMRARVLGYVRPDGFAWVPPGHFMEGEVYQGKKVGDDQIVSAWATAKILRSLSETYKRTRSEQDRRTGRKLFEALRRIAEFDAGRAFYKGGSGAWLDGKWLKSQFPTAAVEPVVTYWEATGDPEALAFAHALAEGLMADVELLPKSNERIQPNGEFHGHMHSTLHGVWGVAHLGAVTGEMRYVEWAKKAYDYASQFGTGTGWVSAALWDDPIRELSETCATSDLTSIATWIAQAGFPEYWDHVERTLRNYLRPQQFFVTAEYEKMYRDVNRAAAPAEIDAGLARMRDLQGAIMGGPAPNDWINWIASPAQCGPYQTPYGCMGMFGCCIPEGMRALHTIWSNAIRATPEHVAVNLSLNRESDAAKVVSYLPGQGRIEVTVKRPGTYWLRPPSWAPRSQVRVLRRGRDAKFEWDGPALAYVSVKNAAAGEILTLVYPLVTWQQVTGHWASKPGLKLTISWKGNAVMDMQPRGTGLPFDFANLRPIPPLPEE